MSESSESTSLEGGAAIILGHVRSLPDTPGVYRMLSARGEVLYVGKAKSLKRRVHSYTQTARLSVRIQRMVALTQNMEFVHTHTEAEALLLESNLIKKHQPRFNVLMRDDKSFPYILITDDHDYPQVVKHRGVKVRKGAYYGPFAGAGDVNRTIIALQRAFLLRNCTDTYFAMRTRPCLQYHIKRCTAPCVQRVSKEDYAAQVELARSFLDGRSTEIQKGLAEKMEAASAEMDFETAAEFRDRIKALSTIQARQDINLEGVADADVMALWQEGGKSCVQVFFFRAGCNYGNRSYFPRHDSEDKPEHVLSAFMAQFYENKPVPREIIVSHEIEEKTLIETALGQRSGHKIEITRPERGKRKRMLDFVLNNAKSALAVQQATMVGQGKILKGVAELFGLDETPKRIEVYDNSHISGTNMVGGMIVAGQEGFRKNAYRKFNIKTAQASDDYGMMREVLERRFKRALKDGVDMEGDEWPDIVLIDGGLGQYNAVKDILKEMGIFGEFLLVAISKGIDRHSGREKFHMEDREAFQLPINDPVLHYLQRLRDEAHRFAIGTHRAKRQKQMTGSPLDEVAGIGSKRKKALLLYFGSAKAVAQAGIEDLQKVEGVSRSVAQKIYDHFH